MKKCALCSSDIAHLDTPALLFVGKYGKHYEVCTNCETLIDSINAPKEEGGCTLEAINSLYNLVWGDNVEPKSGELLSFFADFFKPISTPQEENIARREHDKNNGEKTIMVNCNHKEEPPSRIEFCGELSKKSKQYILKKRFMLGLCISLIITLLFVLPLLYVTIVYSRLYLTMLIPASFFSLLIPILLLSPKKDYDTFMPYNVVIIEDGTIVSTNKRLHEIRSISQVKKVVDIGVCYQIFFYFPEKSQQFVCQKDLIKQGTIQDFEKLFEDKLVRKIKKQ